jgi:hypothetical protein
LCDLCVLTYYWIGICIPYSHHWLLSIEFFSPVCKEILWWRLPSLYVYLTSTKHMGHVPFSSGAASASRSTNVPVQVRGVAGSTTATRAVSRTGPSIAYLVTISFYPKSLVIPNKEPRVPSRNNGPAVVSLECSNSNYTQDYRVRKQWTARPLPSTLYILLSYL